MPDLFIRDENLKPFVSALMGKQKVMAPVAKKNEFVFAELEDADELRLDYDVTILPPKKAFFPATQNLVEFSPTGVKSCIEAPPQILFGVHFYDVKAIDMLDHLFEENHRDNNYLARRNATTIVASNVQNVSKRAFFGSVGTDVQAKGHDAFLSKIKGGYVLETRTPKGEALIAHGTFENATKSQVEEAKKVNQAALKACPETLRYSARDLAEKSRKVFGNDKIWAQMSELCFSCGTCNIVCPTCYCFDVQDEWNLDQVSGYRYRKWDGCQLYEFSMVSLGGGVTHNFRQEVAQRYRHRFMRKMAYLNDTLGGPACVGCGRCSTGCVPDIADPVKTADTIMEQ